ncbi:protein phosphatase 2C domain-containing protein [Streptomyces canus]
MSQQGGTPTGRGHEDDWWGQLYDSTDDTGPTPAPDTLDDRFASAAGAVRDASGGGRLSFEAGAGEGRAGLEVGPGGGRSDSDVGPGVGGPGLGAGLGGGRPGAETGPGGGWPEAAVGPGGEQSRSEVGPGGEQSRSEAGPGGEQSRSGARPGGGRPGSETGPGDGQPGSEPGAADEQSRRPGTGVPAPRTGFSEGTDPPPGRHRIPWQAPPDASDGPASFPPGPKPPGFVERPAEDRPPPPPGGRTSTEKPPATTVPTSRMPTEPPRPPTAPPPHPSAPPRPVTPPPSPQESDRAVSPDGVGGAVSRGDVEDGPPQDADRAVEPGRGDFGGPGVGRVDPRRGDPASGITDPGGGAEDVPTSGGPESPPGPSDRGGAGARRVEVDWWAAAPDVEAEPPAAGPGSTQPNPTAEPPEPPGRGRTADRDQDGADPDPAPAPQAPRTATRVDIPTLPPAPVGFVGSGPPTYDAEPTALPPADPDELDDLVADTVLDGARYGACTLRAVSVRGDSARFRGEPRRDSLLTARFGTGEQALILVAMATGARATPGAHRAAAEACHWIGRAVGRSHARLAQDISAARRGDLKSGLHRLTDRSLGKLRASAVEQGIDPEEYAATLRCLLLPADPDCRIRVFFGVGAGGLFRLRDGEWHDIEPRLTDVTGEPVVGFGSLPTETPEGDRLTMDLGIPTPPSPYEPAPEPPREPFRFRASVARPGDTLLMCTGGFADPLRGEPELCEYLTGRWSGPPPGLAAFLADSQVRVKGYADDRTAAAVWEA